MNDEDTKTVISFLKYLVKEGEAKTIDDAVEWMEKFGVAWEDVKEA